MKKTTYQIPEIRDEKDNIIQSGTYGKNSPLCNETNDGVLDYINNNLEYLKSTQDSIQSDYFLKSGGKIAESTEIDGNGVTTTTLTATGETSVPTANTGNKSKTIANTEFVQNSIASLVDSAPDTLNTLNELAKALNNDPSFATTITNLIAEKESKSDAGVAHTELSKKIDTSIASAHHYIQRNTAYAVGDVLTSPNLPYGTIIVVTQAGTTGADEPDWDSIKNNMEYTDGTVKYKVEKIGGGGVLRGVIMAFSGTFDSNGYPIDKNTGNADTTWHLCDGTNGTPDLRGRFILGVSASHAVGTTGGEEAHQLTTEELAKTEAKVVFQDGAPVTISHRGTGTKVLNLPNYEWTENATGGNLSVSFGENHPHNNMPPYYTLAFIMKL